MAIEFPVIDWPPLTDPQEIFDAKLQVAGGQLNAWANAANARKDEINALKQQAESDVGDLRDQAQAAASEAGTQRGAAEAARDNALASAQTAAASAAANAPVFAPGVAYAINRVVWNDQITGLLYRCIAPYTSGSVEPRDDPVHWTIVGAVSITPSPTSGASSITLIRDGQGDLTGYTFVQDGNNGNFTINRISGEIVSLVMQYAGVTRTETINRDGAGNITSITAAIT